MTRGLRSLARATIPKKTRLRILAIRSLWRSPDRIAIIRGYVRAIPRNPTSWFLLRISEGVLKIAIWLGPKLSAVRLAQGRPRSLWGVTPILTLPLKVEADQRLGFRSTSLVYVTYVITSQFGINMSRSYAFASRHGLLPAFQKLVLAWAILRCDVFHTFADRGLLDSTSRLQIDLNELTAWRAAGKRVYVYAYGADVRTRELTLGLGRWNFCVDCTEPLKYCTCNDVQGEIYIRKVTESVTALVSLGDMLVYMPGAKHLNYWPIDTDRLLPAPSHNSTEPLRIGHAPNHTHFKGSSYLDKTIERLKLAGRQIEYIKIQGVPNTEVIELFKKCDLIADQFIGGAYGYTALEAMALGRPVLSYVRTRDLVEAPEECPLINVTPDTLEEVLTWVLNNREKLPAIAAQGRSYVQRWHSVDAVALRLGELYQETANFPEAVLKNIHRQRDEEVRRRSLIPVTVGWEHPYRIFSNEEPDWCPPVAHTA